MKGAPSRESHELALRPLNNGDLPAALELLRAAMGEAKVPITREYWDWKHQRGPFGPSPGLVAEAPEGQLAGLRVFLPWCFHLGGKQIRAVRAVDTATHPEWQGRGVFSRLTLALLDQVRSDGVAFVYNTPNRSSLPGYQKMGWQDAGRVNVWARLSPTRVLRRTVFGPGEFGLPASQGLAPVLEDPALSSFLEAVNTARERSGRLHSRLTHSYLSWRYDAVPNFRYRSSHCLREGRGALLVGRCSRRGPWNELLLSEVAAIGGVRGAMLLARGIRSLLLEPAVDYALAAPPMTWTERLGLLLAGFNPIPRGGLRLATRSLGGALPPRRQWGFALGDLELL